jgi:dolichol-phosphate mannosyltransferase
MCSIENLPCAVVIVPTFNEALVISKTILILKQLAFANKTHVLKVLIVDSSSSDGTDRIVHDLLHTWSGLHLLLEPERSGLGGAYLLGMRYAIDYLNAEVLISFDADLSHDASKIPVMLEHIVQGDDFVVGTRYSKGAERSDDWVWYRQWFSILSNRIFCDAFGFPSITDWTGGFRAVTREVFEKLEPHLKPYIGYVFQTAFLHQALLNNSQVSEIPFVFANRKQGKSKITSRDTFGFMVYLLCNLHRQKFDLKQD